VGNLLDVLEGEARELGGFGELSVRITFHDGRPGTVDVVERRKRYRLGVGTLT
jgi:hypothetical protein